MINSIEIHLKAICIKVYLVYQDSDWAGVWNTISEIKKLLKYKNWSKLQGELVFKNILFLWNAKCWEGEAF